MNVNRIVFAVVMMAGLPALAFSYGLQFEAERVARTCPAQPGEKLVAATQYRDRTICTYAAQPFYGMAKRNRRAS